MKNTIIVLIILLVLGIGAYFIFSNNNSYQAPTKLVPPIPKTPATSNVMVSIKNFAFVPPTLTVKNGTRVTWTNNDSTSHTVTADVGTLLNSPTLLPGQSYSVTFATPDSISYHCNLHPNMKGQVVVTS